VPYLLVQTSVRVEAEARERLLAAASVRVSELLGKAERYVMVALRDGVPMRFAGSDEPCAYLELKSIGLQESQTPALSAGLCALVREHLGVPPERTYIEFAAAPRALWGWNGGTF